jgi:hypothetical protein
VHVDSDPFENQQNDYTHNWVPTQLYLHVH